MTIAVVRKRDNNITMEGSTSSSINSRSTAIKTILLAAWRGKLTNEEWESRIRKVLPRGVNGDVYDLADCLLKQALIGPVPNQLFISYLKHAVHCELVSHSAVLRSISNQPINLRSSTLLLYRTSPIVCLLEFLKLFRDKISCKGTEIECLNLCHSLSNLLHWLLKCILQTIEYMINSQPQQQQHLPQQQQQQQLNINNLSANISSIPNTSSTSSTSVINQQTNVGSSVSNSNINTSNNTNNVNHNNSGSSPTSQNDATKGIIDLCTETIHYFIDRPFTKSLLFINKIDNPREFSDNILKTVQTIQQKLVSCPQLQCIQDKAKHYDILHRLNQTFNSREMHPSMIAAQQLRYLQTHRIRSTQTTSSSNFEKRIQQYSALPAYDSSTNYALFNSLYPLVAFDAILRPARLNKYLARQIVTIANFNSAPVNMTYCELIRVCLVGLIDAHGNSKAKASWSFFTFLKLPRLLIELNRLFRRHQDLAATTTPTESNHANNFINDLKKAFERLCEYSPLLDEAEYKCNCDLFKCLVKELIKNDPSLTQLKNFDFRKFPARRPINLNNNNLSSGLIMLRAEPFVTTMLETLKSEQDPEKLYEILYQSCSGGSFDCTLSAAAATGRFHLLVTKLIELNELYKLPQDSSNFRNNQAQALNFDITFLNLIYIAQRYGPKLIDKDRTDVTFNKWYHECYNQDSCFSCPKEMLKNCDEKTVTSVIKQLVNRSYDVQLVAINWHDVCFNLPKAIDEILNAWIQGTLNDDDIALVIERLRTRMCFMAVVAATWLQFHLRTLDEAEKAKPLFLLNGLTNQVQHIRQQPETTNAANPSEMQSVGYTERSSLMNSIIKRIYFELAPNEMRQTGPSLNTTGQTGSDESQDGSVYHSYKDRFISTLTTQDIFLANVKQCLSRGWIDYDSLNSLSSLFKIIGSECFTDLIVEQILTSHESPSDLSRAVNITFGLFHLDIEACAFALIRDTIPNWLMGEKKQTLLNQPRAFALANLAVMTIIEVYNNLKSAIILPLVDSSVNNNNTIECGQEKNFSLNGIIKQEPGIVSQAKNMSMMVDSLETPSSILSLNGSRDAKRAKLMQDQRLAVSGDISIEQQKDLSPDKMERLNKLNCYISDLMRLFKVIMSDPVMSHRTLFPVLFLQQTVVCAREESTVITVHLQPEILLDIIDLFSSEMTFELVLAISNLSSTNGRKYTSKAICKLAQVKESTVNE